MVKALWCLPWQQEKHIEPSNSLREPGMTIVHCSDHILCMHSACLFHKAGTGCGPASVLYTRL